MNYDHLNEVYDDYLEHYGVLGMKWGVRRYQNPDGTYTLAGKERYKESRAQLESARANVKTARTSGSKKALKTAKKERNVALKENLKAYANLQKAKSIDRGERLSKAGYTRIGVRARGFMTGMSIQATEQLGRWLIESKVSNQKVYDISNTILDVGALGLQAVNMAQTVAVSTDLRNYAERKPVRKKKI